MLIKQGCGYLVISMIFIQSCLIPDRVCDVCPRDGNFSLPTSPKQKSRRWRYSSSDQTEGKFRKEAKALTPFSAQKKTTLLWR